MTTATSPTKANSKAAEKAGVDGEVERREHPAPAVRHALQGARPTLGEIATVLGIPTPTLNAYLNGQRRPSNATRFLLAAYIRTHAHALEGLAEALEAEAKEETKDER